MENLGTAFGSGIIFGFLKMAPMLIALLLFKYGVNKLLEKPKKKKFKQSRKVNKKIFEEIKYISITEIANHFKIKPKELNIIFSQLKWSYKSGKWWIATDLGIMLGAKQYYDSINKQKYVKWEESIKDDEELIEAVKGFKTNNNFKTESSKEKGERYEAFIAEYYKELGYVVWEHGKEKGRIDKGIDLIVKKKKEIIFIQCKNWHENTRFKIDHVRVKASRAEARQFMLDNPLFKGYKMKFRYTLSNDCMHPSAIKYIEETNGLFDYEVIEIK